MNKEIKKYLSQIGRIGGLKSRRSLSSKDAKKMTQVREARRAFRNFYTQCFWSFDENYNVTYDDIPWVVEQLRKYGNRVSWSVADKLCR